MEVILRCSSNENDDYPYKAEYSGWDVEERLTNERVTYRISETYQNLVKIVASDIESSSIDAIKISYDNISNMYKGLTEEFIKYVLKLNKFKKNMLNQTKRLNELINRLVR